MSSTDWLCHTGSRGSRGCVCVCVCECVCVLVIGICVRYRCVCVLVICVCSEDMRLVLPLVCLLFSRRSKPSWVGSAGGGAKLGMGSTGGMAWCSAVLVTQGLVVVVVSTDVGGSTHALGQVLIALTDEHLARVIRS